VFDRDFSAGDSAAGRDDMLALFEPPGFDGSAIWGYVDRTMINETLFFYTLE
jgi:hypothetical protein